MVRKPSILILGSASTVQGPQTHLEELGCDIRTAHKAAEAAGLAFHSARFDPRDV